MKNHRHAFIAAGAVAVLASAAAAQTATWSTPALDRWMYPFAGNGSETAAPVFGAVGNPGFDDRDGQMLIGFNLAAGSTPVPTGLGASNYNVTSVKLTVTHVGTNSFTYDPTYDSYSTYLSGGVDTDAGRPLELHGVGFRNGYDHLAVDPGDTSTSAFKENSAFGSRDAYAIGFDLAGNAYDVSNNVKDAVESNPFALGQIEGLSAGDAVPTGTPTTITFELDLSDPAILQYVQEGLDDGRLGLVLSGLFPAAFGGSAAYPRLFTKENTSGVPASLEIAYTVPEPASLSLVLLTGGALLRRRRRC